MGCVFFKISDSSIRVRLKESSGVRSFEIGRASRGWRKVVVPVFLYSLFKEAD